MSNRRMDEMSDEQLRREVKHKRAEVAADVDALTEKLSRENIRNEAGRAARDAKDRMVNKARDGLRTRTQRITDGVRANPYPYALIAGGVGWLLVDRYVTHAYTPRLDEARMRAKHAAHRATDAMRHAGDRMGRHESGISEPGVSTEIGGDSQRRTQAWRENADARFRDIQGRAGDRYRDARQRASLKLQDARIAAGNLRDRGSIVARDTGARAQGFFEDHPLAVGGMALAMGIGVGLLLPTSQREVALVGDKSRTLHHRARRLGTELKKDVGEIARTTAQRTAETAKETVRKEAHSHHLDNPKAKLGLEGDNAEQPVSKPNVDPPTSERTW